jgi:broad specificity phosphatase PhoE
MKIKKAVFIRHGETDWNAEQRWQEHTDIPLNENGIKQANEVAARIKIYRPEVLLSSDLKRAHQTAQIIAKPLGIPVYTSEMIREVGTGAAEGLTLDEVIDCIGEDSILRWRSIDPAFLDFSFPGGETKRNALKRGRSAIESFLQEQRGFCAAFVFHGMLMRTLIHNIFPELQEPVTIVNCKHFHLGYDPESGEWIPYGELAELVKAA